MLCSFMFRENRVPYYQRLFQNHDGKRQWWKVSTYRKGQTYPQLSFSKKLTLKCLTDLPLRLHHVPLPPLGLRSRCW